MYIQLIINTEVDLQAMWEAQNEEGAVQLFPHRPAEVNEMIDNTYLIIIEYKDQFDAIERAIEDVGNVKIISSHNEDGTEYIWDDPNKHKNRKHTIKKYCDNLKSRPVLNELTQEYDIVEYTEQEAVNIQVNHIAGWAKRQL